MPESGFSSTTPGAPVAGGRFAGFLSEMMNRGCERVGKFLTPLPCVNLFPLQGPVVVTARKGWRKSCEGLLLQGNLAPEVIELWRRLL